MWVAEGTVPSGHCLMHSHTWGYGTCLADSEASPKAQASLPVAAANDVSVHHCQKPFIYLLLSVAFPSYHGAVPAAEMMSPTSLNY